MKLADAVILITGGNSGLGKSMAENLIKKGSQVIITGRDAAKTEKVAHDLGCDFFHADVANDSDIEKTYAYVLNKYDKLDVLINNAGIGGWSPIETLTREQMRKVYEVNVFGAAMMAAGATKIFKKQNYGNIVNIASTASLKGYKNGTIYSSSKFALRSMSQCWQAELRPYNVRVIQINPSEVPTAFGSESRDERPLEENKLSPQEIAHAVVSALEMDDRGFIPEVTVHATNPF
ncbi:MAG: SDR family oxidoreductase [Crocinitomicaceae bacterium]|nr:SDR family oxidoreductase [Crocinitomicaceae bacterium]